MNKKQIDEILFNFLPYSPLTFKRHPLLWIKWKWMRIVKGINVVGFFGDIPIITSNYIVDEDEADNSTKQLTR